MAHQGVENLSPTPGDVPITGTSISPSGFFGWIDGLLDTGQALLADQFPERFAAPGKGEVRDSEVDAQLAREQHGLFGLTTTELAMIGGALVLVVLLVRR